MSGPDVSVSGGRPSSWFEGWIVEETDPAKTRAARKREVAQELLEAVKDGNYDAQTFQALIQILDHECLCLGPDEDDTVPEDSIRTALRTTWADGALQRLSERPFRFISTSSPFEHELQSRSLGSILALLRAQKVEALRPETIDELRRHFSGRFKELEWQRLHSGPFTRAKFRHFQAAFLLCSSAEYVRLFRRAEPLLVTALSRLGHILFAGAPLAVLATSGAQIVPWQRIFEDLNEAMQPLWANPNERVEALFNLQALTRLAVSSHLLAKVKARCTGLDESERNHAFEALSASHLAASVILTKILAELSRTDTSQCISRPSSRYRDYFLAILNRGPPSMNPYFYYYGLLDCATQLSRILPNSKLAPGFTRMMRHIIRNSEEDSYRWKAVEFLLADRETRAERAGEIQENFKTASRRQKAEYQIDIVLNVTTECFEEEEGHLVLRHSQSISSSQNTALASQKYTKPEMLLSDWHEGHFPPLKLSRMAEPDQIPVEKGKFWNQIQYLSAGLSTDHSFAYFSSKDSITIFALQSLSVIGKISRQKFNLSSLKHAQVVLARRFLALIADGALHVIEIVRPLVTDGEIRAESFPDGWSADCLAIHETNERTWISVGGRAYLNGVMHSSIKLYRLDTGTDITATLKPCLLELGSKELRSDFLRGLRFCADGLRLYGFTKNNCILSWILSEDLKSGFPPFRISRNYAQETNPSGITSVSMFQSPSSKPYMLATTWPSHARWDNKTNKGEWTFISPVGLEPVKVPDKLIHDIYNLRKAKPILAGAVSPNGNILALLEKTGNIHLFPLHPGQYGLECPEKPIILDQRLSEQEKPSTVAIGFHVQKADQQTDQQLFLYAVDIKGTFIRKPMGTMSTLT